MRVRTDAGRALEHTLASSYEAQGHPALQDLMTQFTPELTRLARSLSLFAVHYGRWRVVALTVGLASKRELPPSEVADLRTLGLTALREQALGPDTAVQPVLRTAVNNTARKGDPRDCGESSLAQAALEQEWLVMGGIHIVARGDRQRIAEIVGLPMPTLPPCDWCRGNLREHPAAGPDLPITSYTFDLAAMQQRTLLQIDRELLGIDTPPPSRVALGLQVGQLAVTPG